MLVPPAIVSLNISLAVVSLSPFFASIFSRLNYSLSDYKGLATHPFSEPRGGAGADGEGDGTGGGERWRW